MGTIHLSPKDASGIADELPLAYVLVRQIVESLAPHCYVPHLIDRSVPPLGPVHDDGNDNINGNDNANASVQQGGRMPDIVKIHYGCDASTYLLLDRRRVLQEDDNDDDDLVAEEDIEIRTVHVTLRLGLFSDRPATDTTSTNTTNNSSHLHALMPHCPVSMVYDALTERYGAPLHRVTGRPLPPKMLELEIVTDVPIGVERCGPPLEEGEGGGIDDDGGGGCAVYNEDVHGYELKYTPKEKGGTSSASGSASASGSGSPPRRRTVQSLRRLRSFELHRVRDVYERVLESKEKTLIEARGVAQAVAEEVAQEVAE